MYAETKWKKRPCDVNKCWSDPVNLCLASHQSEMSNERVSLNDRSDLGRVVDIQNEAATTTTGKVNESEWWIADNKNRIMFDSKCFGNRSSSGSSSGSSWDRGCLRSLLPDGEGKKINTHKIPRAFNEWQKEQPPRPPPRKEENERNEERIECKRKEVMKK